MSKFECLKLQLYLYFEYVKEFVTSGKFAVGFVAFSLHIFIQISSVTSRHFAVAAKIPSNNIGIYFTKLFSTRGLVSLGASIASYIIELCTDADNIVIGFLFWFLILLSRFIIVVTLHVSDNLAFDVYIVFILDAVTVGLFQMAFYALTTRYVSVLSISFKLSKITVFFLQIIMDLFIYDQPLTMIKTQYWFGFIITCISTGLWFNFCVNKDKTVKSIFKLADEYIQSEGKNETPNQTNNVTNGNNICEGNEQQIKESEPSFWKLLGYAISPLFMCLVTLMMKNILYPSILPYSLLERDKCHTINMIITPVGLIGSTIIHILKENVSSIREKWEWYWHLLWVLAIPPFIIFILIFVALHTKGRISQAIIYRKNTVMLIVFIFYLFHSTIESAGYLGVVSNVKHCKRVRERGRKVVTTNQMSSLVTSFIFYKFAIGYSINRKSPELWPEEDGSLRERLRFWIYLSFVNGFKDFINDFHMNIKKYI